MYPTSAPVVFVAKPDALLATEASADRLTRKPSRWASQLDNLFFTNVDQNIVEDQKRRLQLDKLTNPQERPKTSPRALAQAQAPDASAAATASSSSSSDASAAAAAVPSTPEMSLSAVAAKVESAKLMTAANVGPAVVKHAFTPTIVAPVAHIASHPVHNPTPPASRSPSPNPLHSDSRHNHLAIPIRDSISLDQNVPLSAPSLAAQKMRPSPTIEAAQQPSATSSSSGSPARSHQRAVSAGAHAPGVRPQSLPVPSASSSTSSRTSSTSTTPVPTTAAGHSRQPSSGGAPTAGHSRNPSGENRRKSLLNVQPVQRRNPQELHAIELWLKAAASGNLVDMKKLLQTQSQFVNVNSMNEEGQTALSVAVSSKQVEVVKALLQVSSIDPNIKDLVGHTPLHVAARSGRQRNPDGDSEKMVITRDLNIINGQWIPPIDKENEEEDKIVEMVRLLCADKRVDVNSKDSFFCSPLVLACAVGNLRVVYTLVKAGAAVNTNTATQVTPLHTACEKGYVEIVKLLVSRGAKVDVKDKDGYTPLHLAAQKCFVSICKILKRAGANVYAQLDGSHKIPTDLTASEYIKNYLLGPSDT